jgi:hypothetical protein
MEFEEEEDNAASTVMEGEKESSEFSEPTKSSLETATLSDADLIQKLKEENAQLKNDKEYLEQRLEEMQEKFESKRVRRFYSSRSIHPGRSSFSHHGISRSFTVAELPMPSVSHGSTFERHGSVSSTIRPLLSISLGTHESDKKIDLPQQEIGHSHPSELVEGCTPPPQRSKNKQVFEEHVKGNLPIDPQLLSEHSTSIQKSFDSAD